jgi:hypothetical protein
MNKLVLVLALVAGSVACQSQHASIADESRCNVEVTDGHRVCDPAASGCCAESVAAEPHCNVEVTNGHRICDSEASGCCAERVTFRSFVRDNAWIGQNWWWLWGPNGVLRK